MKRHGFSLIELLIVVAIISLLLQLALPAVEMSREAARRTQCQNNLRQIGIAAQLHVNTHESLPTGGWTSVWVGDPKRGYGKDQPGGWCYNLLPYMEEQSLHDMGINVLPIHQRVEGAKMFATPVPLFVCPSRRLARPWPFARTLYNIADTDRAGRSDYAANIGNLEPLDQGAPGPTSYKNALKWRDGDDRLKDWVATRHNGIVFQRSMVTPSMITDGQSKTFFGGEKFLSPDHYKDGESHGDDQSLYIGFDRDTARSTNELHPPIRDEKRENFWVRFGDDPRVVDWNFGSAHPSVCHMVSCDGSVSAVAYDVDMGVFSAQGSRAGETLDSIH